MLHTIPCQMANFQLSPEMRLYPRCVYTRVVQLQTFVLLQGCAWNWYCNPLVWSGLWPLHHLHPAHTDPHLHDEERGEASQAQSSCLH